MTANTITTIWCDGYDQAENGDWWSCGEWFSDHNAKSARATLRSPGAAKWLTNLPGGRDLCARHAHQRDMVELKIGQPPQALEQKEADNDT